MENKDVILENTKELVCNNGFDKVTVKMICEKTNISRKTFYSFYQDKYDILEHILIKDIINELNDVKVDNAVEMDYLTYFYSSSSVMLIKKWILDGYVLTPKQIAEYYQNWAVSALANNYFYCK